MTHNHSDPPMYDCSIVVTGAAGFAGSHLVDLLAAERAHVAGWRRPGGSAGHGPAGVEWMDVDLLDANAVRKAIAVCRPAAVYHCAGAPQVAGSWDRIIPTLEANVVGTHNLLEAVRLEAPRCRVLVTGSALVYKPSEEPLSEASPIGPRSPYALSKLAQELLSLHAHRDDGADVVLTRSFNHFGPRQDPAFVGSGVAKQLALIEAGRLEPILQIGNLDARRDLTDVRDTVCAYRDLLAHGRPGVIYNVCSGQPRPIRELVRSLVARANVRVEIRIDPGRLRPNDVPLVVGDARRIREEIGWTPTIPFEQTVADLLDHWRAAIRA
jgi:GDP-4-dehydro-6-deoxy-D-mannose reductase